MEAAVDAVLESVALCCPELEILALEDDFSNVTKCNKWALQLVLDKCTKLKHLILKSGCYQKVSDPPDVIVSNEGPPLANWVPAGTDVPAVV